MKIYFCLLINFEFMMNLLRIPACFSFFEWSFLFWEFSESDSVWFIFYIVKVGDRCRGRPQGSLFNSYYTEVCVWGALLLSLDCSTLPSIRTLYCWVLNREVSSTIFIVYGMKRPGIEPRSPGSLPNTTHWANEPIIFYNLFKKWTILFALYFTSIPSEKL